MKYKAILIAGGLYAALMFGACDDHGSPDYYQALYDQSQQALTVAKSNNPSGKFACNTASGGCFYMSCDTQKSCDYLRATQKEQCVPVRKDEIIVDAKVCADYVDSRSSLSGNVSVTCAAGAGCTVR